MSELDGWFDNHCHLDDDRYEGGTGGVLERARQAGVSRMITVGTDAVRSRAALAIAAANDGVWATAGLHPHDAVAGVETVLPLLDEPGVVAVGECGLDYHYDHSPRPVQRDAFAAQIALARERDLPLVVHTREAWPDTFDLLTSEGVPSRVVFHCFTGGPDEARRCLDLGGFLSFSGIVTFTGADELRQAVRLCPEDRLLIETDSPYLAPVPHRGRRNEPAFLPAVGGAVATIRGISDEFVRTTTAGNAVVAFALGAL